MKLLKWVEKTPDGYDGVEVTTWNDTFCDGKAFSAVLHKPIMVQQMRAWMDAHNVGGTPEWVAAVCSGGHGLMLVWRHEVSHAIV